MKALRKWMVVGAMLLVGAGMSGCGGHSFQVARAGGKVTCNGQPVTGGRVMFSPIAEGKTPPGKAAFGEIGSDGTFVLSTFGKADGAVVGKHEVTFMSAYVDDEDDEVARQAAKLPCQTPKGLVLEVVAGQANDFNIEMSQSITLTN